jgi:outer membrane scaffolding protein for murein synthesis (MipA/OmpV family)
VATFVSGSGFVRSIAVSTATLLAVGFAQAQGAAPPRTEGAIGLVVKRAPDFLGSSRFAVQASPAGFLRWKWLSVTGDGGFTTRSREVVEGGLAAVLAQGERSRLRLGLAWDGGRKAASSAELAGLDDVPATVRVRLGFGVTMPPGWRLDASLAVDALGRGAGALGQVGVSRAWSLSGRRTLAAGLVAVWGDDEYQALRLGISPLAAVASGLPAFDARAGWQSAQLGLTWRIEFDAWGQPWSAFASASHTVLLGDAARSPVSRRDAWTGVSAGLVWRF